jgi:hypothetical protein
MRAFFERLCFFKLASSKYLYVHLSLVTTGVLKLPTLATIEKFSFDSPELVLGMNPLPFFMKK